MLLECLKAGQAFIIVFNFSLTKKQHVLKQIFHLTKKLPHINHSNKFVDKETDNSNILNIVSPSEEAASLGPVVTHMD